LPKRELSCIIAHTLLHTLTKTQGLVYSVTRSGLHLLGVGQVIWTGDGICLENCKTEKRER